MKVITGFAIVAISMASVSGANFQFRATLASDRAATALMTCETPLKLTMHFIDRKYCTGDTELDGLKINVRLVYTNTSNRALILYKGSNLISRIMIGKSLADIEAGRYEVDSSLTQVTSGGEKCFKETVPQPNCFVVLSPGSSYEVPGTIGVFVLRDEGQRIAGAVGSGEHVLQVRVSTWPNSETLAEKLHRRWLVSGSLWYEPVTSEPLTFRVEKQRPARDCP